MWVQGPKYLSIILLLSQVHQQEPGSEVEQSGLKLMPVLGAGIADSGLTCHTTMLAHAWGFLSRSSKCLSFHLEASSYHVSFFSTFFLFLHCIQDIKEACHGQQPLKIQAHREVLKE